MQPVGEAEYASLIDSVFEANDNFLVKKPTGEMDLQNTSPFTQMTDKEEIKNYIMSDKYWANQYAIETMCSVLKLQIIVIERDDEYNVRNNNKTGKAKDVLLRVPFMNNCIDLTHYMFLYHRDKNHYELMTFNYSKQSKAFQIPKQISIFDKDDKFIPPFYILLLLYESFYSSIKGEREYTFLKLYFKAVEHSIEQINGLREKNQTKMLYNQYYEKKFPSIEKLKGGQNPYPYQNPYPNPYQYQYQNPYPRQKTISENDMPDTSKTSIYIKVYMELEPGTSLTPEQLRGAKCRQKKNAIVHSFDDMLGREYNPRPVYTNYQKTAKQNKGQPNNTTRKMKR